MRFTLFGRLWGNLENFGILMQQLLVDDNSDTAVSIKTKSRRYCRLIMHLLFAGIQQKNDVDGMIADGLVVEEERAWLEATPVSARCLLVFGWLSRMWENIKKANMVTSFSNVINGDSFLIGAKGGIGGTLGMVGCPLPYSYVHVVYWTVQMLLSMLAVETGTLLAIYTVRGGNGECISSCHVSHHH